MSAIITAIFLAVGILAGFVHFTGLAWNTRLYMTGGSLTFGLAVHVLRLGMLAALLVVAALQGALPLLGGALGVLIGRAIVLRRQRTAA